MKVALVTCAHNEDRYIDEWLRYHVKLGFDRIVVVQNNWRYRGSFSHPNVEFIEDDGHYSPAWQGYLYTLHSQRLAGLGYQFVAAWDIDEFLVLNECDNDIHVFLNRHASNKCIFIRWRIFGDNNQPAPDGMEWSVLKRFTRCDSRLHWNGKSIAGVGADPKPVWKGPHHLLNPDHNVLWRKPVGEAELFHFRNKTRAEYDARFPDRCYGPKTNRDTDFRQWNHNETLDYRARDFLYPPEEVRAFTSSQILPPVDMIFALCYTGYKAQRMASLRDELCRVGFTAPLQCFWTFPTPYDAYERDRLPADGHLKAHIGWWSCTKGHYSIIKTAYELGCRRILIIEDDIRFLTDTTHVVQALQNLPADWDILLLDYHGERGGNGSTPGNRYWRPVTKSFSTGAYILNRRALARLISLYEEPASSGTGQCLPSDMWLNKWRLTWNYRLFVSRKPLAIQNMRIPHTMAGRSTRMTYRHHPIDSFAL